MSRWTYVTGVVEVDTCARSDAEAMYLAQTVVNHLPRITGSEQDVEFHFLRPNGYCSSSNVDEFGKRSNLYDDSHFHTFDTQEKVLIVMHGRLRDRIFEQTLHETAKKMLVRLSSRLLVTSCSVRVKSDKGETFLFDNPEWICNREITEWTRYLLWL